MEEGVLVVVVVLLEAVVLMVLYLDIMMRKTSGCMCQKTFLMKLWIFVSAVEYPL